MSLTLDVAKLCAPSGPKTSWLFLKGGLAILAIFAILEVHVIVVRPYLSGPLSMIVLYAFLISLLWLYRIEKYWIFLWHEKKLKVSLKMNGLLFDWITVRIGDELVVNERVWNTNPLIIDRNFRYGQETVRLRLHVEKTREWYRVGCAFFIGDVQLSTEPGL